MIQDKFRTGLVAILSVAILNAGGIRAAHSGIVDTGAMMQTGRDADLATIQTQLAREEVRTQLDHHGVSADAIEARLATLSDREVATLARYMQDAPAGGDGLILLAGVVFIVLLILEMVGAIDIFKRA